MKIALFKSIEHGYESYSDESMEKFDGYIRLSEYVDVNFVKLSNADITAKEISVIRAVKKKIQAETEVKLGELDRKIGDLLSLPQANITS